MQKSTDPDTVLHFWFGDIRDDAETARQQAGLWWGKSEQTDAGMRKQFGDALRHAADGGLDAWAKHPRERLALILVLDQFSRNIHRDTPQAFAQDPLALSLSLEGQRLGHDQALRPVERVFLYMPMEHAEDARMQARSVAALRALRDAVAPEQRPPFETFVDFALRHQAVIERFGRFPHRNAILGRDSTAAETAFLQQPGSGF